MGRGEAKKNQVTRKTTPPENKDSPPGKSEKREETKLGVVKGDMFRGVGKRRMDGGGCLGKPVKPNGLGVGGINGRDVGCEFLPGGI